MELSTGSAGSSMLRAVHNPGGTLLLPARAPPCCQHAATSCLRTHTDPEQNPNLPPLLPLHGPPHQMIWFEKSSP